MKKTLLLLTAGATFFAACNGGGDNTVETKEAGDAAEATVESVTYTVDTAASTLHWHGEKAAYGHDGTIQVQSGQLTVEGDKINSGTFTVDMSTIEENEDSYESKDKAKKLEGHLMSEDFFNAEKYPTSTFEITNVKADSISGNLTIKDITKEIKFPADVKMNGDTLHAFADFTINRADWNVKYGSKSFFDLAADKIISNDIAYKVELVATK